MRLILKKAVFYFSKKTRKRTICNAQRQETKYNEQDTRWKETEIYRQTEKSFQSEMQQEGLPVDQISRLLKYTNLFDKRDDGYP